MPPEDHNKKRLLEVKDYLSANTELLKPIFGFLYWQFSLLEESTDYNPDEALIEATKVTLSHEDDEFIAAFLATYIELWQSAKDLGAASRFIADSLGMTANELIESRLVWKNTQILSQK
tara:strand:- start:843 stop:1199 length:357 start_codon:yes stop_codon:yes gene_type:complete